MAVAGGSQLGPNGIVASIGARATAHVYRARHTRLGREVPAKIQQYGLVAAPHPSKCFQRKAKAVAAPSHRYLVASFDYGRGGELTFTT